MGVPDELRALDDDLAAGRVDAATYRRRRDDLLTAREPAVSVAPPDEVPGRTPDATERALGRQLDLELDLELDLDSAPDEHDPAPPVLPGPRPLGSASAPPLPGPRAPTSGLRPPPRGDDAAAAGPLASPDPFPPPFRWAAASAEPDVTQVVPSGSVEATQVVRGVGGARAGVTATADPTRVVPGAVVARSMARSSTLPAAGAPPWIAGRATGTPGASAALQRRQGAEVFVRQGPKPAVLISTTLVVLVAVFVVVGSVLLS